MTKDRGWADGPSKEGRLTAVLGDHLVFEVQPDRAAACERPDPEGPVERQVPGGRRSGRVEKELFGQRRPAVGRVFLPSDEQYLTRESSAPE
jgi:hypothetical protein